MIQMVNIHKYQGMPCNNIKASMIFLDESFLPSVLNFQQSIEKFLNDPEMFQIDSAELLQQFIKSGKIIGVVVNGDLVAYCIIYFPQDDEYNLGFDLSFPMDLLHKTAHFESVAVHQDYWGNSLGLILNTQAINTMRRLEYSQVCATVSPKNIYNLSILFKTGFVIKILKIKYGGKQRYILHKSLDKTLSFNPVNNTEIPSTNIESQIKAIEQGFWGYSISKTPDGFNIRFGK
ncbi:MAG: GNAT family N-acetyltransferase [Desulfobacteraceae bacterium]|nr:GNAT family N-acetyltransferase [Desulfobacteraceae bacterium]